MNSVKEDELILVDLFDREIGTGPKLRVHCGFFCFIKVHVPGQRKTESIVFQTLDS